MRRVLFQVHLWVGLIAGVYVLVISVTGAALVFRIDLQRAMHPHLFTPRTAGALADPVTIMESVSRAYPGHSLSGVDAPTTARPTYLAYVTTPGQFATVLIDPVSAEVLGELPENSMVRTLQDLHYDLLAGRTGRTVNGLGAAAVLVMGITGACIWWPGRKTWRRAHDDRLHETRSLVLVGNASRHRHLECGADPDVGDHRPLFRLPGHGTIADYVGLAADAESRAGVEPRPVPGRRHPRGAK